MASQSTLCTKYKKMVDNRIDKTLAHFDDPENRRLLTAACTAAITAGSIIRQLYAKPHNVTMKGVINLVTEADLAAEAAITASLNEDDPGTAIIAEESAGDNLKKTEAKVWVVDPLDGTTNFAHGFPVFATSIALLVNGSPSIGVIYNPMLDELFCSVRGQGAWCNGVPIEVSETGFLIESLIGTGIPYELESVLAGIIAQLQSVIPKVRDIRRAGSAALDLAYVACGRLDAFYEIDLHPWDTAAGWLLVEEAGGSVTDFSGGDYSVFDREILASNGKIHNKLQNLL